MVLTIDKTQLQEFVDRPLGVSDWLLIDQQAIDTFAEVTRDRQYIHVDPESAGNTAFGATIAHGFFTLALLTHFAGQCGIELQDSKMAVNYGFDRVRFLNPVKVNSRLRANFSLAGFEEKKAGQVLLRYSVTVDVDTQPQATTALVADWLVMIFT